MCKAEEAAKDRDVTHFGGFFGHVVLQIQDCRYSGIIDSWRRRPELCWVCLALRVEAGERLALKLFLGCWQKTAVLIIGALGEPDLKLSSRGLPWLAYSFSRRDSKERIKI